MLDLFNKNVLVISPEFFGYQNDIKAELIKRGAVVDFISDKPFSSVFMKGMLRLQRERFLRFADKFYFSAIEEFGRSNYDLVLVLVGEGLSENFLSALKSTFPSAKFVFYMWDSMRNRRGLDKNLVYFDSCFTFDKNDEKQYGMKFRPLFFNDRFQRKIKVLPKYDLSFVGTAHSDRFSVSNTVAKSLPENITFYRYLYLQARWVYFAHKVGNRNFKDAKLSDFNFTSLGKAAVAEIFFNSAAVLDIEHPKQTGLTMRTFEAFGSETKIITTNSHIVDYDFYNPENVRVFDRNSTLKIEEDFFIQPYKPASVEIYQKYSLSGWLDDILV
jgi:hypothetical protein